VGGLVLDHQARGLPDYVLFAHPAGGLLLTQRMANLIVRAATLAGVLAPLAATPAGRNDSGPEEPFAAALVNSGGARSRSTESHLPAATTSPATPSAGKHAPAKSTANFIRRSLL
jgi:hypothetical protein